jgi:hypothetical protein
VNVASILCYRVLRQFVVFRRSSNHSRAALNGQTRGHLQVSAEAAQMESLCLFVRER